MSSPFRHLPRFPESHAPRYTSSYSQDCTIRTMSRFLDYCALKHDFPFLSFVLLVSYIHHFWILICCFLDLFSFIDILRSIGSFTIVDHVAKLQFHH
ncbi:hypothetical protein FA13DRAFT_1526821 [Coprinellus micaceus]|uniref:Uncharacterized protein n=1 Tax=Coprinellus micaceus TaxID=71717 RepID=A0A4Y7SJN9_COPMI|nr:hypothetical protein FA13DRAFT_1526821 [Coprinellus micaceus]